MSHQETDKAVDLEELLRQLVNAGGSDLHLKVGSRPKFRVDGELYSVKGSTRVGGADADRLLGEILPSHLSEHFTELGDADFAVSFKDLGRFRVSAFSQRGSTAFVLRHVAFGVPTIEELVLPDVVKRLAEERRGLVLVTGPTGSGKSTTLAAMIDHINRTRSCSVVTIEDPIEYLHKDRKASISQREIGLDAPSFEAAMRASLRQDPDVILVGEMRDELTASIALQAAATGHLVLSTLHSSDAAETLNRIVDIFPPSQQLQIRASLASSLKGTLAQRLVPAADGGRVPIIEALVVNGRVEQLILEQVKSGTGTLADIMEEGSFYGMQTFDKALCDLVANRRVRYEDAVVSASSPHDFRVRLERAGVMDHRGHQRSDVVSQLEAVQGPN